MKIQCQFIRILFLNVACLCIGTSLPRDGIEADAFVNTDCGRVRGSWVTNDGAAYVFRGIPYAEPPIGKLRWKPPVPVSPRAGNCWNGTLNAKTFGEQCYQTSSYSNETGSEDCLYLNVWSPDLDPMAPLPVMVWIHGGFLLTGNGNMHYMGYAPTEKLAHETNVVYVSLNYRLNAFGFMALEWLKQSSTRNASGNYGLMDMLSALEWVKRNIASFGGDPHQVTIFGQSSGGTSIFALLGSPLSKGLFHKAWLMSASPVLNKTATEAFKDNEVFIRNSNCSDVDCLYNLTAEEVLESVPWNDYPYWSMDDLFGLPVKGRFDGALLIVDGYVLREAPFHSWTQGRAIDVPLLIGTTAQETDFMPAPLNIDSWNWASGGYESYVRSCLQPFGGHIAETALRLYPPGKITPEYQYTTMVTDLRVTCSVNYLSQVAARNFRSPVYRYVATYSPSQTFSSPYPSNYSVHGIDAFAFFGGMDYFLDAPSADDLHWGFNVRKESMAFVKTGKPASTDWTPYTNSTALLSTDTSVVDAYHKEECYFWLRHGFFSYSWIN